MPARVRPSTTFDVLNVALISAGSLLAGAALLTRPADLFAALGETFPPFATLAALLLAAAVAARLGLFGFVAARLERLVVGPTTSVVVALAWVALLSGLVNLDLAVVVGLPLALEIARRRALSLSMMAIAIAAVANATSTLLPTSNLTTLLLLGRSPLSAGSFLANAWLPWLLVAAATIAGLSWLVGASEGHEHHVTIARPMWRLHTVALDLLAMFLIAAAVRAWIGGIHVDGGLLSAAGTTGVLAALVNNLPAAAAVVPNGVEAAWGAILGLAMGPNMLLTGSVATVICRRIARESGGDLPWTRFSLIGTTLLPFQLALAAIGFRIVGVT